MIGTRQFRLGERRKAREMSGNVVGVSAMDMQALDAFATKLDEAIALLRREIEGINAGELNVVTDVYEDKSNILKWLELKMPLVEPFMGQDAATTRRLPERLAEFKDVVGENSTLLERMAGAAGTVVREMEKATQRHSLNGLYGKSGEKITDSKLGKMTIDQQF